MPQLMLQGFPDGAIRIGPALGIVKKEGLVTYFVGPDNYFSHADTDAASQRFIIATLIANRHVRASEVEASCLDIAPRTLMRWTRQLAEEGPGSFYLPQSVRGAAVMTAEKAAQCARLLDAGGSVAAVARQAGVNESTLRKALRDARVVRSQMPAQPPIEDPAEVTTKSQRSRTDAEAAEGKMIAYRAETALVALLRPHLAKEDEARAMIRELFVSSADLVPDETANTLTVRIHRMASPAHDKAIAALLDDLTQLAFLHPETHARLIYQLV